MTKRLVSGLVGLVAACLAAAGCGTAEGSSSGDASAEGDGTGILRYGAYEPGDLDPRRSGPLDTIFLEPVFDSLIKRTGPDELEPGLATEWQLTDGAQTLELTLREGVEFQDGTPFDAEAVKQNILSAKEPGASRAGELSLVTDVEVVDATHVRITMSAPNSAIIGVLAGEAGMMVSPASLDAAEGEDVAGAGPYELVSRTPGKLEYRAWDGYWAADEVQNEGLDFVINNDVTTQLRALKSGEIDGMGLQASQKQEALDAGLEIVETPVSSLWQIAVNVSRPGLSDPRVRLAILHAIDRQAISDAVLAGTCVPTMQAYSTGFPGYNEDLAQENPAYDLARAEELMAEAGVTDLTVEMMTSTSTQQQEMAAIVQQQLAQIGIEVELNVLDYAQNLELTREGEYDLRFGLAVPQRPDPTQYVIDYYLEGGKSNPTGFELPGAADLVSSALSTDDAEQRGAALEEIGAMVYEAGPPIIPICTTTFHFAHREGISGWQGPALNDFDFAKVVVE